MKAKTAIFIDAANMFYAQKTINFKVDYLKFSKYLNKRFNMVIMSYYTGFDPKNSQQIKFLEKLKGFGITVHSKAIKRITSKNKVLDKANVDVEMAIDAILDMRKYKNLILASGDSDFAYLVRVLKSKKKKVFVISARGHISKELIKEADKYIPLESLRDEIKME